MDKQAVMLHVIVSYYSDTPHIKLQKKSLKSLKVFRHNL